MQEPRTELDERFSDPGTSATTWAETVRVIRDAQLFFISTTRPDGRPHVTPLVAVWVDDALHFSTGPDEQKGRNLASTSEVVLTTGSNSWNSGLDVMVEGTARRVSDATTLQRLADVWREKWDGRWTFEATEGGFRSGENGLAHVYAVSPRKVLAFGKEPFTHTSHTFGI